MGIEPYHLQTSTGHCKQTTCHMIVCVCMYIERTCWKRSSSASMSLAISTGPCSPPLSWYSLGDSDGGTNTQRLRPITLPDQLLSRRQETTRERRSHVNRPTVESTRERRKMEEEISGVTLPDQLLDRGEQMASYVGTVNCSEPRAQVFQSSFHFKRFRSSPVGAHNVMMHGCGAALWPQVHEAIVVPPPTHRIPPAPPSTTTTWIGQAQKQHEWVKHTHMYVHIYIDRPEVSVPVSNVVPGPGYRHTGLWLSSMTHQ